MTQHGYGPPERVLRLEDVAVPAVAEDEVLVRVQFASVHADVWHVVNGLPYALRLMAGLRRPRNPVPGTDMAGTVAAIGGQVIRFRPGDEVFGETVRGYQWSNGGAYAEYVSVAETSLASKPPNITFEQAASVPTSGLIAMHNLGGHDRVQPGSKVLVNGAGGGVGALAVQLAKSHGAAVTGVDHPAKLEMIRSLGADDVVDYTVEDFIDGTERYDLIFDVASNRSFSEARRVLKPSGLYVRIGHDHYGATGGRWLGSLPWFFKLLAMSRFTDQLPDLDMSEPPKQESMEELRRHLVDGTLTPVVGRVFALAEAAQAIEYLAAGQSVGRVLISAET